MADQVPAPQANAPIDPNAKSILLLITYLIPLVAIYTMMKKGDNSFFVHHSKNAAGYLVLLIALNILFRIAWVIIPSLAVTLATVLNLIYLALFIVIIVFGILPAWHGKEPSIPLITGIGQKIPLEKWFGHSPSVLSSSTASAAPITSDPVTPPVPTAPTSVLPTPPPAVPAPTQPSAVPVPTQSPETVAMNSPSAPAPSTPTPPSSSEPTNNPPTLQV